MPLTRTPVGSYSTALSVWSAGPLPVSETFWVIVWRVKPGSPPVVADAPPVVIAMGDERRGGHSDHAEADRGVSVWIENMGEGLVVWAEVHASA